MDAGAETCSRRSVFRAPYAVLAVALGGFVFVALNQYGLGGGHALSFALAPDLAFFYGVAPGLARGQLHPRAVRLYNALHSLLGPVALAREVAEAPRIRVGPYPDRPTEHGAEPTQEHRMGLGPI